MEIVNLQQGSAEWLDFRRSRIGASDAPIIMGMSPYRTPLQLYYDKMGGGEPLIETDSMRYGKEMEGKIRDAYNFLYGKNYQPCVAVNPEYPWMCASYDGYDGECFIEIKAANKKDHEESLKYDIPNKYAPQIAHQFLVSKLRKMKYLSWNKKGLIEVSLFNTFFNRNYYHELIKKEEEFYECLLNFTPPK